MSGVGGTVSNGVLMTEFLSDCGKGITQGLATGGINIAATGFGGKVTQEAGRGRIALRTLLSHINRIDCRAGLQRVIESFISTGPAVVFAAVRQNYNRAPPFFALAEIKRRLHHRIIQHRLVSRLEAKGFWGQVAPR